MTEPREIALVRAAAQFRRAVKRSEDIKKQANADLAAAIRTAYGQGMKKSEMLRVTGQVWSRTWIDNVLKSKADDVAE